MRLSGQSVTEPRRERGSVSGLAVAGRTRSLQARVGAPQPPPAPRLGCALSAGVAVARSVAHDAHTASTACSTWTSR